MKPLHEYGFLYERATDGVVTVTMDMPGPVNTMNESFGIAFGLMVTQLEQEAGLRGVILRSAKKTFIAGGDIKDMLAADPAEKARWFSEIKNTNSVLRRLERLPVPVVAAINGAAFGGGLEVCLACNHSIAINTPGKSLGLPEVTIGLFPGGGGVVRSIHLMGLEKALPLSLEGTAVTPAKAKEIGWIGQLVDSAEDLLPAARAWIAANPKAWARPWDIKGHTIPHGDIRDPGVQAILLWAPGQLYQKTRGLLPAPEAILSIAAETVGCGFDAALRVQDSLFVALLLRPESKNLMVSNFVQLNQVKRGPSRPRGIERSKVKRLGVLGAGMMGNGIARAAAAVGIEVVLRDTTLETAQNGKAVIAKQLAQAVAKGRMTESARDALLDKITPAADASALQGVDFIVEAVFEDAALKNSVTKQVEPFLAAGGVFGSNTSTLPISMLAQASAQPDRFIGVHFFSPVERMQLVEIIRGDHTSDETIAKAFDFVEQLGKIAIIVNDGPGFFTSRVYGPYLDEGSLLLEDGVNPVLIDAMAKAIGMPVGPLAAHDEVSLELSRKVISSQRALGIYGTSYTLDGNDRISQLMAGKLGRGGRHYGGGFYEYPAEGPKFIWPELYNLFDKSGPAMPLQDIKDRILFRQVIETVKCFEDGILNSVAEANIGALYGIGAPAWTGGYLQFINTYGLQRFSDRANALADSYGTRFRPPAIIAKKLSAGESFV